MITDHLVVHKEQNSPLTPRHKARRLKMMRLRSGGGGGGGGGIENINHYHISHPYDLQ
jgi:hypothetical protein